jgi:carboxyl-terminal processing protease
MRFRLFQLFVFSFSFALIGASLGYSFGRQGFLIEVNQKPVPIKIVNQNPAEQTVDFGLFWQAWNLLSKDYYQKPLDAQSMLYGAISGLYAATGDPYTTFLDPTQNKTMNSTLDGQYEGVGVELGVKNSQLVVIAPLDGSPAIAAGIKPGDKILTVDDATTAGLSLTDAVAKIRGGAGTIVTLKLQRDDLTPFEVKITRGKITVKSVKGEVKAPNVAYIRVSRFGESSSTEWDEVVARLSYELPNLKGVVLDLRGNPGGYTNAAIHIAGEFIKEGVIFYEQDGAGVKTPLNVETTRNGRWLGKKVVVLLNGGSASSSEILAGALLDRVGAVTVGEKSFGKGVVQTVADLAGGSAVHITVAKWLTPGGTWVQETGLIPKYVVAISDQDIKDGKDPQLDKALAIIGS